MIVSVSLSPEIDISCKDEDSGTSLCALQIYTLIVLSPTFLKNSVLEKTGKELGFPAAGEACLQTPKKI